MRGSSGSGKAPRRFSATSFPANCCGRCCVKPEVIMSQRDNLKRLLAPRHLAFVGGRSMARALKRCAEGGYQGQMWLVNPQHAELDGVPCVASVTDLPCGPDAVFIATNRELTLTCVAQLAAKGAGGAICYSSGFAETGAEGLALQQQLLHAAGDMAVLGPNCYGWLR